MKKNVLSVVVMVLAIAGLVFSSVFFAKKSDFVQGWKKLASAINRGSAEMDKGSGTEYAESLSVRNLQHEKYAQMDRHLMKLQAQSRAYAKSRDVLAQAAAAVAAKAGISKFADASTLSKVNDSAAVDEMTREVNTVFENRDRSYANAAVLAKGLGYTLDTGKLTRGESDALEPFFRAIGELANRRRAYEKALKSIAVNTELRSFDLSENGYKSSSQQLLSSVAKYQSAHEHLAKMLDQARAEKQKLSAQDEEQKTQIAGLRKTLSDRERQIAGFKQALQEAPVLADPKTPWTAGSREAKAALEAKVSRVDEQYGIVTIDAGSDTTVTQRLAKGAKPNVVNVGLAVGNEIIIVRGELPQNPEYLTSLKLEKVDGTESVGRIPAGCTDIRVGDRVILRPIQNVAVK